MDRWNKVGVVAGVIAAIIIVLQFFGAQPTGTMVKGIHLETIIVAFMMVATWGALYLSYRGRKRRGAVASPVADAPASGLPIPFPKVRTAQEWTDFKLEQVPNRKFEYSELILDGKNFVNCTFTHMHLYYDGTAPMAISPDCVFDEDTKRNVHTHSPGIAQWMENIRSFGLLREEAKFAITPLDQHVPKIPTTSLARKEYVPFSPLQVIDSIESFKFVPAPHRRQVRLVCTPKGKIVGELLARILITSNIDVMFNRDNSTRIFPPIPNQPDGIVVRAQSNANTSMLTALQTALTRLDLHFRVEGFPPGSLNFNQIQIEIGDRSQGDQWD
jgi:hypothetical protein